MEFWKTYTFKPTFYYRCICGDAVIWVHHSENGYYFCRETNEAGEECSRFTEVSLAPEEISAKKWERCIIQQAKDQLSLFPVMPDLPLVIRPDIPLRITRGNRLSFFINIPLWLRLRTPAKIPESLFETPAVTLSQTWFGDNWFGDTWAGELCYVLRSQLLSSTTPAPPPHTATCAVTIINNSSGELSFERVCIHVENLAVYKGKARLWTNPVQIHFSGLDQLSQISILPRPPHQEKLDAVFSEPRQKLSHNLVKRSFQFIKDLAGF